MVLKQTDFVQEGLSSATISKLENGGWPSKKSFGIYLKALNEERRKKFQNAQAWEFQFLDDKQWELEYGQEKSGASSEGYDAIPEELAGYWVEMINQNQYHALGCLHREGRRWHFDGEGIGGGHSWHSLCCARDQKRVVYNFVHDRSALDRGDGFGVIQMAKHGPKWAFTVGWYVAVEKESEPKVTSLTYKPASAVMENLGKTKWNLTDDIERQGFIDAMEKAQKWITGSKN